MDKVRQDLAKCKQDLAHSFLVDTRDSQHFYTDFDQHDQDKGVVSRHGNILRRVKMEFSCFTMSFKQTIVYSGRICSTLRRPHGPGAVYDPIRVL